MKVILSILAALSMSASPAWPQSAPDSVHVHGPKALEGWKRDRSDPNLNGDRYPVELIVARHGHIIRRIPGQPFVWNWIFWKNGTQIAYEVGPLHFAMQCVLADLTTGRQIATIDCFSNPPGTLPAWADALDRQR